MLCARTIRNLASRQLFASLVLPANAKAKRRYTDSPVHQNSVQEENKLHENKDIEEGGYSVSEEDFKWVERLFPPSRVPQPPKHKSYPTPSGWFAPSESPPDKPYFVRRNKLHALPVIEVERPKRSKRWITSIRYVEGDIMALEKELVELLRPHMLYDPATRVNELSQTIWIKGLHREAIEKYLYDLGF